MSAISTKHKWRTIRPWILWIGCSAFLIWLVITIWYGYYAIPTFLGYTAKTLCSGVFVSQRNPQQVLEDIAPIVTAADWLNTHVDPVKNTVTVDLLGIFQRKALYRNRCGCTLIVGMTEAQLRAQKTDCSVTSNQLPVKPSARFVIPEHKVEQQPVPSEIDLPRLHEILDAAFKEPAKGRQRQTRAIVVVYDGRLITEKYAPDFDADTPMPGWSMSKSVVNAMVGILVRQGRLRLHDPAPVPEWQQPGDPRGQITLNHLLRMSSGLKFGEVYAPASDVTDMLFRSIEFAALAASQPLEKPPGQYWHYSSGTTNILARIVGQTIVGHYESVIAFAHKELFAKLNMRSAVMELDPSGTMVGSSYVFASARDWARFGLLYLQDGIWLGEPVLAKDWIAYTRTPAPAAPLGKYGAHFWLNAGEPNNPQNRPWPKLPADMFYAQGFQGQSLSIIPSYKLVVVRLGLTLHSGAWNYETFIQNVLATIAPAAKS